MNKLATVAIVLGLLGAGCKKDKNDEGGAGKPGAGSASASGTGTASASGSGTGTASASGSGTATASGSDSASGSASASGAAAPAGGPVTLELKVPAVGSVEVKDDQRISDLIITNKGQKVPMHVDERKLRDMKVVEAGDFVQKVEVTFEMDHKTSTMGGKDKTEVSPLERKSYVVWADADKIAATNADGSAVPPDELELIGKSFDDELGHVPGIAKVLASHPWNRGEEVTLTADEMVLMDAGHEGGKMLAGTITLVDEADGKATFKVATKSELTDDKMVGKLDLVLTVTVDVAACRPLRIEALGKLDGTAGGMQVAGDMNGTTTFTY